MKAACRAVEMAPAGSPWHAYTVSELEELIADWLPLPDVAERLDVSVKDVRSLLEERALLAAKVGERQIRSVPAAFLLDSGVLESLKGTLAVLSDAGFTDEEALRWLFTADDSLPGRPIDALREGRKTEIRRRAQALGW
jgi:Rv2175c C-terminal domain of unknown function